ncbi:MAG: hypothetical protein K0R69_3456 [Clostridia bacterium]|jgi:hypothetical protein|nr:hypothetical protein [Clostridia bacterium]
MNIQFRGNNDQEQFRSSHIFTKKEVNKPHYQAESENRRAKALNTDEFTSAWTQEKSKKIYTKQEAGNGLPYLRDSKDGVVMEEGIWDIERPQIDIRDIPEDRTRSIEVQSHQAVVLSGNIQWDHQVSEAVKDKGQEVKDAVYGIIEKDFFVRDGSMPVDERHALIELGLQKADYIAKHYMNETEAKEFMSAMTQMAKSAKLGKADVAEGIHYNVPKGRLIGAPEDYINAADLMQKSAPDTYAKYEDAKTAEEKLSILHHFVTKEVPQNPKWREDYLKERSAQYDTIDNVTIDSPFQKVISSDLDEFIRDVSDIINTFTVNTDSLFKSLNTFRGLLTT